MESWKALKVKLSVGEAVGEVGKVGRAGTKLHKSERCKDSGWFSSNDRAEFQEEPSFGSQFITENILIVWTIAQAKMDFSQITCIAPDPSKPPISLLLIPKVIATNQVARNTYSRWNELPAPPLKEKEHPQFSLLWEQKYSSQLVTWAEGKANPVRTSPKGKRP